MKKIKIFAAVAMFCAAAFAGYTAYEQATMTDAERFMFANIEALTDTEIIVPFICLSTPDDCHIFEDDGTIIEGIKIE